MEPCTPVPQVLSDKDTRAAYDRGEGQGRRGAPKQNSQNFEFVRGLMKCRILLCLSAIRFRFGRRTTDGLMPLPPYPSRRSLTLGLLPTNHPHTPTAKTLHPPEPEPSQRECREAQRGRPPPTQHVLVPEAGAVASIHTYIRAYRHTYIHAYMHTYMHACMHT